MSFINVVRVALISAVVSRVFVMVTTVYPGFQADGAARDTSESFRKNATESLVVPRTVDSVADLATITPYDGQVVTFRNYYSDYTGGSNTVRWIAGDSTTADAGLVFDDGVNSGRWHALDKTKVTATQFGVKYDGSDGYARLQAAVSAARNVIIDGQVTVASTVVVGTASTNLHFTGTGGLTYSTATMTPLRLAATGCKVRGGTITAPATFDATNSGIPTYAVVEVTANDCSIHGLTINNVPKVGILFKECNGGSIVGCVIRGGTDVSIFTGTQTGHFGVSIDVVSTYPSGDFVISGCQISECVQGVSTGNFGATADEQGFAITGCSFRNCWNHGVYGSSNGNGFTVSANTFTRCQIAIALTGKNHAVCGNAIQTQGTGTQADYTGISLRNPVGCVVDGNTIKGEVLAGTTAMGLTTVASGYDIAKNIISNNVVDITTGAGSALKLNTSTGEVHDNIISGNYFRAPGASFAGILNISSTSVSTAHVITGNTIIHTGVGYGISLSSSRHSVISGNTIRLEVDSGSATTLAGILLTSVSNTQVATNKIYNTSDWGENITYRAIQESSGCSANYFAHNLIDFDTAKLTGGTAYFMLSGSGTLVHGSGATAPSITCAPGSTWSNTGGSTGTSFYVKESAANSATWTAK